MTEVQKDQVIARLGAFRERLLADFEAIEAQFGDAARAERKVWQRPGGGGGEMGVLRGRIFEKVGVNFSAVEGVFEPEFAARIPGAEDDPRFWACGVSVVAHPANPFVPTAHMNIRHLITTHSWFGGGADLTPVYPVEAETAEFHAALKTVCDRFDPNYYQRFKEWCDRYFYLPHRDEARGVGGIFFDQLDSGDAATDLDFIEAVGEAFRHVYCGIARRGLASPFGATERREQLIKRGRYVEFNLLHDRGTLFGLKTGGNIEAILMSLPPEAAWP